MAATAVVVGLLLTGAAFLVAASYMVLSALYSPALAALLVGGGLLVFAGLVWLVSEVLANRRRTNGAIAPIARAAVGVQSGDEAVDQIVAALKQETPLSILAAAAGLLFGLFLRSRHG